MSVLEEGVKRLKGKIIPGELIFKLYDTYGFPSDMTADFARENRLKADLDGYEDLMAKQKEREKQFLVGDLTAQTNEQRLLTTEKQRNGLSNWFDNLSRRNEEYKRNEER